MSLVYAAITPHSPVSIACIGKEHCQIIDKTIQSFHEMTIKLKEKKVETIIIISPHGKTINDYFSFNFYPKYRVNFSQFGDLATKTEYRSDLILAYKLKQELQARGELVMSKSEAELDYGQAIPLCLLLSNPNAAKIIPFNTSTLSLSEHFSFGQKLLAVLDSFPQNIALIASADLSHRLKKNSPAGYSPKGAKFDRYLLNCLDNKNNLPEVINISDDLIKNSGECGLKPISVLSGALSELKTVETNFLSYQSDLGIGYLSMDFIW